MGGWSWRTEQCEGGEGGTYIWTSTQSVTSSHTIWICTRRERGREREREAHSERKRGRCEGDAWLKRRKDSRRGSWIKKEGSGRKGKKEREYEWKINGEKTEMEDGGGAEWGARGATLSHSNQWGPGMLRRLVHSRQLLAHHFETSLTSFSPPPTHIFSCSPASFFA